MEVFDNDPRNPCRERKEPLVDIDAYVDRKIEKSHLMPYDFENITDIQFDGVDWSDYPDFCDAFIQDAVLYGEHLTQEQLDELNDNKDFVYEKLMNHLF